MTEQNEQSRNPKKIRTKFVRFRMICVFFILSSGHDEFWKNEYFFLFVCNFICCKLHTYGNFISSNFTFLII